MLDNALRFWFHCLLTCQTGQPAGAPSRPIPCKIRDLGKQYAKHYPFPLERLMRIGIPAETRQGETRVAATPETVKKLVAARHQLIVQSGAGLASSVTDEAYTAAGAQIGSAADALGADMVLKVRAPN